MIEADRQGARVRKAGGMSGSSCLLLLVGLVALGGCANEENLRKSKGFYQEGVARLSSDQQQAYVSFQKAVKLNPDNKEAHYGLGHIYASQGRLKLAEESFREAIRIDGDYAEANTYLGQVLASQDRWKDAIAAYRQALSNPLYPTPDLARFQLGKALMHEGDLQGAMEVLEDATTVTPWWQRVGFRALAHHRLLLVGSSALAIAQRAHLVPRRLGLGRLPIRVRVTLAMREGEDRTERVYSVETPVIMTRPLTFGLPIY